MKSGCWKIKTVLWTLILSLFSVSPCLAVLGVGDVVFDPQALQQQMTNYSMQIRQYQTQIQQFQMQMQNMQSLGYKNDFSDFYRMQQVMNSATGVSNNFTTMQRQFQQLYPDFTTYNNQKGVDYAAQSTLWSQQNQRNAYDMLTMTTKLQESIAQDRQTLQYLNDKSSNASGEKDLLQNINQLLILQSKQLMQLQQLISTTAKADAAYLAQKASNEAAAGAASNNAFKDWDKPENRTVNHNIFDVLH